MEKAGLVTRRRDPANRWVHQLTLTEDGEAAFHRMRAAAMAFDERLRSGIPEAEIDAMTETLQRLAINAARESRPLRRPGGAATAHGW
ncbi:hypothetical protein Aple_069130 [Acrocarpospora pleiomorpha]|uniref:HTH marR-type domain-containing protein n=1 Tax=Acrocarpospora pleiomorpha TaxID=90975 RepID=A0A5M3XRZ9_9ACTN|nr:hypothetical protein [Acrocarpospora pleiomorpha]GES24014.1 hypothetical protein Aple_069130 [Acrocarpospora pleiomorpha]